MAFCPAGWPRGSAGQAGSGCQPSWQRLPASASAAAAQAAAARADRLVTRTSLTGRCPQLASLVKGIIEDGPGCTGCMDGSGSIRDSLTGRARRGPEIAASTRAGRPAGQRRRALPGNPSRQLRRPPEPDRRAIGGWRCLAVRRARGDRQASCSSRTVVRCQRPAATRAAARTAMAAVNPVITVINVTAVTFAIMIGVAAGPLCRRDHQDRCDRSYSVGRRIRYYRSNRRDYHDCRDCSDR